MGLTYLLPPTQAREPFSETTNAWATAKPMPQQLSYVSNISTLRQSLESGHFEHLTPYSGTEASPNFARMTLHHAPDDDNCQYLSLENVTITLDKKGKPQESTSTVVPHLAISANTCRQLRSRFSTVNNTSTEASPI
ncbi:MAG: hypothetical protein ACRYFX_09210 [Janthinobacterium lividum]